MKTPEKWVEKLPAEGNYVKYRKLKRRVGGSRKSRVLCIVSML